MATSVRYAGNGQDERAAKLGSGEAAENGRVRVIVGEAVGRVSLNVSFKIYCEASVRRSFKGEPLNYLGVVAQGTLSRGSDPSFQAFRASSWKLGP